MNDLQKQFLDRAAAEAVKANHPFPQMAACEAALESTWGQSELAREANNLFGMKQHVHEIYGTMTLPTHEVLDGKWTPCAANWVKYPDWRACFADRLATLERLSNAYPHYKAALDAKDARTYITEVSESWSTDALRALKVMGIYSEYVPTAASPGAAAPSPEKV
jgi:flagellum-specific peptidoglycan hydrolase FlgJ